MYRSPREFHRLTMTRETDVLRLVADYRFLTAGALAARERREALLTEQANRLDRAFPRASWRERLWGWFCRRVPERDGSFTQTAIDPPLVPSTPLEQPAATIGA